MDGKDITRIVYQNDQDKVDGKNGSHTVATLDDGLKFSGDDNKVITKKLNEQLQFVGGADKDKLTQNNIGINELEDGKLTIQLVNTPDLGAKGNLKAGDAHIGWFDGDTLNMTRDGTNPSGNKAGAGSYATGLSNTDWNCNESGIRQRPGGYGRPAGQGQQSHRQCHHCRRQAHCGHGER